VRPVGGYNGGEVQWAVKENAIGLKRIVSLVCLTGLQGSFQDNKRIIGLRCCSRKVMYRSVA